MTETIKLIIINLSEYISKGKLNHNSFIPIIQPEIKIEINISIESKIVINQGDI